MPGQAWVWGEGGRQGKRKEIKKHKFPAHIRISATITDTTYSIYFQVQICSSSFYSEQRSTESLTEEIQSSGQEKFLDEENHLKHLTTIQIYPFRSYCQYLILHGYPVAMVKSVRTYTCLRFNIIIKTHSWVSNILNIFPSQGSCNTERALFSLYVRLTMLERDQQEFWKGCSDTGGSDRERKGTDVRSRTKQED